MQVNMKTKQKSYLGSGLENALTALVIMVVVGSAILGWVSIEGIIWLFRYISLVWLGEYNV